MSTQPDTPTAPAESQPCEPAPYAPPETYDPAAYRWVPVRRVARRDGWTEEKQRRFIEVLADTGQVGLAVKEVGLSRESAYRLRRQPHATAFARAWDAACHHAGAFLEDVAFERAIEGQEKPVFNEHGEVIATKRIPNDRMLMFLLRHLKPERYAPAALAQPQSAPEPVDATLRAMEPALPAPAEQLLDPETLAHELTIAEVGDGALPGFLAEKNPPKSPEQLKREEWGRQEERGKAARDKMDRKEPLSDEEFADMCSFLDPAARGDAGRKRYT